MKCRVDEFVIDEFLQVKLKVYTIGDGKPTILITGGIHGDETTGVYAAFKLKEYLLNTSLKGTVKIIPISNPIAFRCRVRASPIDNTDLNRVFPGNPNGSHTSKIAAKIWEIAQTADYILDLHCCGQTCHPYILAIHKEYQHIKNYILKIPLPYAVESSGLRGQLFIEASHLGKPAAIIEVTGGRGIYNPEIGEMLFEAVKGLLTNLNLIEGEKIDRKPKLYDKLNPVTINLEGFFKPKLKPGTEVKAETIIGEINGQEIKAGIDGLLIRISPPTYVFKGESIASIAAKLE
ncbi:MAG: succinylglutamate desuccinylase/aspartoacylase family protein [archaeon GB-1867-035]|nr:succinylglutamate desuccinylase/aspartoacylase family protein [Candidatus Culexmicrobium profundum]